MKYIFSGFFITISLFIYSQNPNPSGEIDSKIAGIMNRENFSGLTSVIVKDNEIIWLESYGYANTASESPYTDSTSQMIASISKLFTGIAIMQLKEAGKLKLDDNINKYLPFEIKNPKFENYPITFRMLLTHTSSIKDSDAADNYYNWEGDPLISLADCIKSYFSTEGEDYNPRKNFMNKPPGSVYEYSNMATALEGYLVELISGQAFYEYCNKNIFEALCFKNTNWFIGEYSDTTMIANPHIYTSNFEPQKHYGFADYPDGMLHTNAKDLANFMVAVLQQGIFNDNRILSQSSFEEMLSIQIPLIDEYQGLQFYKEEFSVSTGNILLWGHSGSEYGITTELFFDTQKNIAIAVLANADADATDIFQVLYDYATNSRFTKSTKPECEQNNKADSAKYLFLYDVFPNPATNFLTFRADNLNIASHLINISDLSGKIIISAVKNNNELNIDISGLAEGNYLYTIKEEKKIIESGKFIVKR